MKTFLIQDIKILKSKIINNKKGNIIKIINKNSPEFIKFGELYFSEIKRQYSKGWNLHKKYYCQLGICYGHVEIKFKDKKLKIKKIFLSEQKSKIIIVPPTIWFKVKSKTKKSVIFNILSNIHDRNETLKKE